MRFLTRTMVGWHRAWAALAEEYGDERSICVQSNEVWQYMSTTTPGLDWYGVHQFRHRDHPSLGRVLFDVPELPGDFDEQPNPQPGGDHAKEGPRAP
jgi:hypothetical protein